MQKHMQKHTFLKSTKQQGSSLLVVLVVLLVLSLLATATIDSTGLQSTMTRNNQMRLEAFNSAMVEIEGQLDNYEASGGTTIPTDINALIGTALNTSISSDTGSTPVVMSIVSKDSGFSGKSVGLTNNGGCPVYGSSLGVVSGSGTKECILLMLSANAKHDNFTISSDQRQTFGYIYQ